MKIIETVPYTHLSYQYDERKVIGNDVATYYTYNPHGLLTRINTGNKIMTGSGGLEPGEIDPGIIIGTRGDPEPSGGQAVIVDSAILNYRYAYDPKGLMISRSEGIINRLEEYEYDKLDRLTKITSGAIGQSGVSQIFSYYGNGNFASHSAVGEYAYTFQSPGSNITKAHAVSEITPTGSGGVAGNECNVIYNSFNQPSQITEDDYQLDLFYGVNQQRYKTARYKNDNLEVTRYYIDKRYEIDIDSTGNHERRYHYIYGDNGVVALYIADTMYYIHTDHLGSYCAITNDNKEVIQRNYFDPWGNSRKIIKSGIVSLNFL